MTRLWQWVRGELSDDDAAAIAEQVEADGGFMRVCRWLQVLDTNPLLPLEEPPPLVQDRLRQHFRRWDQERRLLGFAPLEHHANLVMDTRGKIPMSATRGAPDAGSFQLVYSCSDADVVIDVEALDESRMQLSGQVLMTETTAAPIFEVTARGADAEIRNVDGDAVGRFVLPSVPVSTSELELDSGQLKIYIPLALDR